MRRLLSLLAVLLVAGAAGCGGAAASSGDTAGGGTERFTQGGGSMEPTVKAGQVITVRDVGRDYGPKRGDIVLFRGDGGQWRDGSTFLKRVIAVGGETVACCDSAGRVTVNGAPLDESYVANNSPLDRPPNPNACTSRRFGPVAVASGTVFVMGDNRAMSYDSRCLGPIAATSVFAVMDS